MSQIVAIALGGALLLMQSVKPVKIATPDDFQGAMIAIGQAFSIIEMATGSNVYLLNSVRGDALTRHDVIRANLSAVSDFFERQQRPEAKTLATEALSALNDVRDELAAAEPDEAAAAETVLHLRTKCAACHAVYREGSPSTGYRLKR